LPRRSDAHVFTIPPGAPFARALAKGLLGRLGDPLKLPDVAIYLPTRRAARTFSEIFAAEAGGAALLPEFKPLGDADEDETRLDPHAEQLDLPPAITPLRRRLLLAALIRRWDLNRGGTMPFGQAAGLALSLASVMDEAERQGADLTKLDELAPAALAAHWAEVRNFLVLIREEWPRLLAAEGCINPAARRNQAILALAERLQKDPPPGLTIAAGSTGSMPATAALLSVIARLPNGAVVLPGLDLDLDEESWTRLDPGHPQYAMKQLLARMDVARGDVALWSEDIGNPARARFLSEVLRPAPTTDAWRALAEGDVGALATGLEGLSLLEAADPAEEAAVIALALREALDVPGRTAALITLDRALARRVAAEMKRWNISIDDSAGRKLTKTRAGSFLCLLAEATDDAFSPVPLLALLKHPLATMDDPAEFRRKARQLDLRLRGVRPDAGLDGIKQRIAEDKDLAAWFGPVAQILSPLAALLENAECPLTDLLGAHLAAVEALAGDALWAGADGEAANAFVAALGDAAADLPDIEARSYAPLFHSLADEIPVRPAYGSHPRLAILGPLEARMQSFDLTVLGSLNEGSWPMAAAVDPWFSRPMRRTLGLEQLEARLGLSAHDFATLAAGKTVLLTRAAKADGSPAVASRWLQRLDQLAKGLKISDRLSPSQPYRGIAQALNDPGAPDRIKPPAPTPPVDARPRRLTVTEIETWLRDPYAIYAKHVLRLRKLDPLDAEIGPLERGSILHGVLEKFVGEHQTHHPADALAQLTALADEAFEQEALPKAVLTLWRPRFIRAARWFLEEERKRLADIGGILVEIDGALMIAAPAGDFELACRADRIDKLKSGGAAVIDYKTGSLPRKTWVATQLAPQLALEGAILAAGGFAGIGKLAPNQLIYVRFSGGAKPGEFWPIAADIAELCAEATAKLKERIAEFDRKETPYLSRVLPKFTRADGDYDHLARVREWSASGWQEDGE
jgi:ATP-dependent helicase/nuclease subunit B